MRHCIVAVVLILALGSRTAMAGEWEGQVDFGSSFVDNFFQAPDDQPKLQVTATSLRARLTRHIDTTSGRVKTYADILGNVYDVFDSNGRLGGGLNYSRGPHGLEGSLAYYWNRPSFDVGDEFDKADGVLVSARYSYRTASDFQLNAAGSVLRERYESRAGNDNTLPSASGSVRYRGFGYGFSPEVGVTWSWRNTDDPNSSYSQRDLFIKVRSLLGRRVYLTGRYRYRSRDYSTENIEASNFGREDTRQQLTLSANVRTGKRLTWNVYYALQDVDSTLERRIFDRQLLRLGLTIRF